MSTTAPPVAGLQNPWPGLFSYTEEQAYLFFGRERETEELLRLIQRETLTVLFGRSGLGKTSLLRAGVFPALRQTGCFPVVLRLDYAPQASSPVEQVKALTEAAARESGIDVENTQGNSESETLWEYFHRVHFWGPRNDTQTAVLIFDQFEEIFTIGNKGQADLQILEQLADLAENRIPATVRQRAEETDERRTVEAGVPNYKIVVSLREDFVWRLDTLRPILPAIMRNRFALGPLDAARALEIIRKPGKPWVTEEVAQDIIEAVISNRRGEESGHVSDEVEPAYLNVMCNELFERMARAGQTQITRELVASEKGGILESLYERSLSGFHESVRQFVEQHLVTPAGFRATMPVEEARREHISDADLQKLVDRRLLRFEDRLGAQHVELAHDLLTGLVLKSREERKRARLQLELRRARVRAAILGAAALLGIAGPVYYWLAYLHPSVSYYVSFSRRNGSYEMIGRLSKNDVSHLAEALRVTRKGFRGEVLSVEAVNGYGLHLLGSQLDNSLFFPTNGMNGLFCRLEFTYDEKGQAVHEVALDTKGRMVYALTYAPTQAEALRNVRRGSVVAADGTKVLSSFDIQYDSQGYITEIRYLSGTGPQFLYGAEVVDQTNPKLGVEKQLYLGKDGETVPANNGFAGMTYQRDSRGDLTQSMTIDLNGNPISYPIGSPPITRWKLDRWGNVTEEGYFDAQGHPIIWVSKGYQKRVYTLDDHGSIRETRFFGLNGEAIAEFFTGCYGYHYELDESGYTVSMGCVDAHSMPMNEVFAGYQTITFQTDAYGRTIGNKYFDRDGKPVSATGCYGRTWGYDADFNQLDPICLDANGNALDPEKLFELAQNMHNSTFEFPRALELDQQLVKQDPTPVHRLDLGEAALTADQFDLCLSQAASITDSDLNEPGLPIVRDAIRLACQFGSGKKADAQATAASLQGRLESAQLASWDFNGTRFYVQTSPRFQVASDGWDRFFESLANENGKKAANALSRLQSTLKD